MIRYLSLATLVFFITSCSSTTKQNQGSHERDPAAAEAVHHPVPMDEVVIKQVCQYEQSKVQTKIKCSEKMKTPVDRELFVEYPSFQPKEILAFAESINEAFAKKAMEKAEIRKGTSDDDPTNINKDSRRRHRLTHSKGHACLVGELKVANDVPEALKVGIFAKPGSKYRTYSRFANGKSFVWEDKDPDARSHSLKILGAPGEKYLYDSENTMDFVMNGSPVFFSKSPEEFTKFFVKAVSFSEGATGAVAKNAYFKAKFGLPLITGLGEVDEAKALQKLQGKTSTNLLKENYYTGIPLMWGTQAVKIRLSVTNCKNSGGGDIVRKTRFDGPDAKVDTADENYYLTSIKEQIENQAIAACWYVEAQVQKDPWSMPIEDTTIEWSEGASHFVPIGLLRIKAQKADDKANLEACENLSYSPWRVPKGQIRPMGDLAKLRGMAYYMSAKARKAHNKAMGLPVTPDKEPDENAIKAIEVSGGDDLEAW